MIPPMPPQLKETFIQLQEGVMKSDEVKAKIRELISKCLVQPQEGFEMNAASRIVENCLLELLQTITSAKAFSFLYVTCGIPTDDILGGIKFLMDEMTTATDRFYAELERNKQ